MIFFMMMVRWSWPRFRFDQLMILAWKVMLPLGLVNLVVMAFVVEYESWFASVGVWAAIALGWIVLFVSTGAVGLAAPLATDNRPRRDTDLEPKQRVFS
jgi:NADH-quinone oxidoreductase subunit H